MWAAVGWQSGLLGSPPTRCIMPPPLTHLPVTPSLHHTLCLSRPSSPLPPPARHVLSPSTLLSPPPHTPPSPTPAPGGALSAPAPALSWALSPQAAVERAHALCQAGEQLIEHKHYAVDSIRPKCHELRHLCDQFSAAVGHRRGLLSQSLELHCLLEAVGPAPHRPTPRGPKHRHCLENAPSPCGPFLWPRQPGPGAGACF